MVISNELSSSGEFEFFFVVGYTCLNRRRYYDILSCIKMLLFLQMHPLVLQVLLQLHFLKPCHRVVRGGIRFLKWRYDFMKFILHTRIQTLFPWWKHFLPIEDVLFLRMFQFHTSRFLCQSPYLWKTSDISMYYLRKINRIFTISIFTYQIFIIERSRYLHEAPVLVLCLQFERFLIFFSWRLVNFFGVVFLTITHNKPSLPAPMFLLMSHKL